MDLAEEIRALRECVEKISHAPKLMTPAECAEFLSVSESVLFDWRKRPGSATQGPPFLHITERTIRYDRDDVVAWARERRVNK
jgi:predicted DNA-binding transcriptional regulator AlpA